VQWQLKNWLNIPLFNALSWYLILILLIRPLQCLTKFKLKTNPSSNLKPEHTILNQPNSISISDTELNQHCLVIGTTGAGKTTTMLKFIHSFAARNLPIVFLDGKGSIDLVSTLQQIAKQYNRPFKVFSLRQHELSANKAGYNPFASGTASEWTNRIMSLFAQASSRGQEHFSLQEQNYINFVASIMFKHGKEVNLRIFLALLEQPQKLIELATKVDAELALKISALHKDKNINLLVNDVLKLLEIFIYSDYGYLFNTNEQKLVINLRQSIKNNEIVLFLFDASTFPEDTKKVARMVINDINCSFAEFTTFTKCLCVFDEFASYASENLSDIISLQRSKGMHAIVGTQSITTVKLKSESTKRVAEELLACCNTFIVHRLNHNADAIIMADIIGKTNMAHYSYQTNLNQENQTKQNINFQYNYKVNPDILKELAVGEAIVYRKATPTIKLPIKSRIL
jgi:conjugal transfer pilus assembly protein TraD